MGAEVRCFCGMWFAGCAIAPPMERVPSTKNRTPGWLVVNVKGGKPVTLRAGGSAVGSAGKP